MNFSDEDIRYAQDMLIDEFGKKQGLFYASVAVTDKMIEREGGSWICDVSPADVEDGLGYHEYKYLHMSFIREE